MPGLFYLLSGWLLLVIGTKAIAGTSISYSKTSRQDHTTLEAESRLIEQPAAWYNPNLSSNSRSSAKELYCDHCP
eukprot:scaffold7064_cov111-Cylindrotheca_fusiformis.AAC.3